MHSLKEQGSSQDQHNRAFTAKSTAQWLLLTVLLPLALAVPPQDVAQDGILGPSVAAAVVQQAPATMARPHCMPWLLLVGTAS